MAKGLPAILLRAVTVPLPLTPTHTLLPLPATCWFGAYYTSPAPTATALRRHLR